MFWIEIEFMIMCIIRTTSNANSNRRFYIKKTDSDIFVYAFAVDPVFKAQKKELNKTTDICFFFRFLFSFSLSAEIKHK